jgi:hypothetical protein
MSRQKGLAASFRQGTARDGVPLHSFPHDPPGDSFEQGLMTCQTYSELDTRIDDIGAIHTSTLNHDQGATWFFNPTYVQNKVNGEWRYQSDFISDGCMSGDASDNGFTQIVLTTQRMPDLNIRPPKGQYVRASSGAQSVSIGVAKTSILDMAHATAVREDQQKQLSLTVGSEGIFLAVSLAR